ncbi:hypothetical protein J2X65_001651 [Ancylobacter sp. 3268]|uniref:phage tail tube protein n=1 Tax=Ancylobacter sp. 3268 TaxID=2817752 RepID=UPI00285B1FF4|nr:phage tail tube protein [Ancylobacter sp. 3268]MDR6952296.1 hypothetical protein [Ancylobacter sp. 3268]
MGLAFGINSAMGLAFEATFGTAPVAGFRKMPFISTTIGAERPLVADDQLGFGRDPIRPQQGATEAGGDVVVGVDPRYFGVWLKLLLGAPLTTADEDVYTHVFTSGAFPLPSASIEVQTPEVPAFTMHSGYVADTLSLTQSRGNGSLQATIGLRGQKEGPPINATAAGVLGSLGDMTRFTQFHGFIRKDGAALGKITSAEFSFGNGVEVGEDVGRGDSLISDLNAIRTSATVNLVARFDSTALVTLATSGDPMELEFGFAFGADLSLTFNMPSMYLPKPKRPISGPGGIQHTFAAQAARPAIGQPMLTATLVNDVASY